MSSTMAAWLRSLGESGLADVLTARPDVWLAPIPRTIGELAARVQLPTTMLNILHRLPMPAMQVIQAMTGNTPPDRAEVANRLGAAKSDPDLDLTLGLLARHALVWEWEGALCAPSQLAASVLMHGGLENPATSRRGHTAARVAWTPRPPAPTTSAPPAHALTGESSSAATAAVDAAGAVFAAGPITLLKTGGVGKRELTRIAKQTGQDVTRVRLWLEIGYEAGLIDIDDHSGRLLPTTDLQEWACAQPADRLVELIIRWSRLPGCVTDSEYPALLDTALSAPLVELRAGIIDALAALPAEHGLTDPVGFLVDTLAWHRPLVCQLLVASDGHPDAIRDWASLILGEMRMLGLVALDALTPLGRALLEDEDNTHNTKTDKGKARGHKPQAGKASGKAPAAKPAPTGRAALTRMAHKLIAPATGTAIFQADLTALVTGTPDAHLAELLDRTADRETRGTASTWRFTPHSVRRALDDGRDAAGLSATLTMVSSNGKLPQPLEYLIADVGRRHGEVRVHQVGSVLSGDETLLRELLASRALAVLRLHQLTPTVLLSARPAAETLHVLRTAGYAPLGQTVDGQPLIVTKQSDPMPSRVRREPVTPVLRDAYPRPSAEESTQLATALLSAPEAPAPPTSATDRTLAGRARHLDPQERLLLAYAIDAHAPILINYTDTNGRRTQRVIEPMEVDDGMLIAWCQLRDDERMFSLSRIDMVAPA